jgi:hypothetical protein
MTEEMKEILRGRLYDRAMKKKGQTKEERLIALLELYIADLGYFQDELMTIMEMYKKDG